MTHLICDPNDVQGGKYETALKLDIPVVSPEWLGAIKRQGRIPELDAYRLGESIADGGSLSFPDDIERILNGRFFVSRQSGSCRHRRRRRCAFLLIRKCVVQRLAPFLPFEIPLSHFSHISSSPGATHNYRRIPVSTFLIRHARQKSFHDRDHLHR
jgi:hypothetical protein